jgi:hypothetical protein
MSDLRPDPIVVVLRPKVGRYHPSRERLRARRLRRVAEAAANFEAADAYVQEVRRIFRRGEPERRHAFRARLEAKKRLFYHVREMRREDEA